MGRQTCILRQGMNRDCAPPKPFFWDKMKPLYAALVGPKCTQCITVQNNRACMLGTLHDFTSQRARQRVLPIA